MWLSPRFGNENIGFRGLQWCCKCFMLVTSFRHQHPIFMNMAGQQPNRPKIRKIFFNLLFRSWKRINREIQQKPMIFSLWIWLRKMPILTMMFEWINLQTGIKSLDQIIPMKERWKFFTKIFSKFFSEFFFSTMFWLSVRKRGPDQDFGERRALVNAKTSYSPQNFNRFWFEVSSNFVL